MAEQIARTFVFFVFTVGLGFIGWGVWSMFWIAHDHFMQKNKRRQATPMTQDELMLRRLKKSVDQRVQTMRMVGRVNR